MFVGFLAEPALLMVLFTASLISGSTSLPTIVETLAHREFAIYPSLAFAGVAFTMVSLAENARIPIDNPATHLELTMIHEAMMLEYSARHLALHRMGVGAEAVQLFVHRPRAVPAVRHRRRQRRLAGYPRRDAGADRQARRSAASPWR